MSLHILKLCVGADSLEDLASWIAERSKPRGKSGKVPELSHRTRMFPRRKDEILPGGSLYWVIKGHIQARQPLKDIRTIRCKDGIERCDLVFEPRLVPVRPVPRRAFQGWRYLQASDAPPDLKSGVKGLTSLPEKMRTELLDLGLL